MATTPDESDRTEVEQFCNRISQLNGHRHELVATPEARSTYETSIYASQAERIAGEIAEHGIKLEDLAAVLKQKERLDLL